MFDYFTGIVKELELTTVVLETGGIGYEFTASKYCLNNLKVDEKAKIYAYLSVREDGVSLYGFYSKQEKAMFMRLTSISGIGPKVAIGVLSGLALDELSIAIANGDSKALGGIKGIGKKTAERIILELRDKLGEEFALGQDSSNAAKQSEINDDAVMALMALGYNKQEAVNAIKRVDTADKSLEEIIMAALKRG